MKRPLAGPAWLRRPHRLVHPVPSLHKWRRARRARIDHLSEPNGGGKRRLVENFCIASWGGSDNVWYNLLQWANQCINHSIANKYSLARERNSFLGRGLNFVQSVIFSCTPRYMLCTGVGLPSYLYLGVGWFYLQATRHKAILSFAQDCYVLGPVAGNRKNIFKPDSDHITTIYRLLLQGRLNRLFQIFLL